jgi:hypothetical protein
MPSRYDLRAFTVAGALALAACGSGSDANLAALDNELLSGNGADPAVTSALEDQILSDPNLSQQSGANGARPPERPIQAQYPAGGASGREPMSACGVPFRYGAEWAGRLPADFPAYPGGRVTEAAGADRDDCHQRVVTFTTADPHNRVLEHYRSAAARAGFSAEQQARGGDQVLAGTRGEAAYYLIVTPGRAGSEVALIVNNGR